MGQLAENSICLTIPILEAEFLLKYSQLTIKSISDKLGFISTSAFSHFFKGIKGISPDNYRNKQEN